MLKLDQIRLEQGEFQLFADTVFEEGDITALMGVSGSGKSTLLAAIAGFLPPASGRITVDGKDITDLPPGERPLSLLFQDQNLFPHLSVAQNVGLGLRPDLRLTSDQKIARDSVLERVGLTGMGNRLPRDLSGGQQSRAALARALLRGRPWLLLDEPFSALGPALRSEMLTLLRDTAKSEGLSVLMVTHAPEDARMIADRTALISDGVLEPPVATGALFDDPTPALRAYLG
ncbi:ATP-binding cassette domain-containing protein [Jannaschia helgolandensis]|uniref:thiamine ABC transporter ATP-binding protein n=1 Tax=Jannaschia helgolandensis TaxID=188906 RepID=UPI0030D8E577